MKAVVIGSGPNGLAGAIALARAGLEVEVHEAEPEIGGGLRSAELTLPGFVHDVCSAIHPLAVASPFFRELELNVEWVHPDAPAAHPFDDGTALVLERDLAATAAALGQDEDVYQSLVGSLVEGWPYPYSPRALLELRGAVLTALSAARPVAERFREPRTQGWFAGFAAHSMLPLERRPSAGFALALLTLGHAVGWPFPRGGSQRLADALAARLLELGGEIHVSSPVDELPDADVLLADVSPRELARIAPLPERYAGRLRAYRHGPGAFKVDWALDGPIPWRADDCARAGTVHLGGSFEEISASEWGAWSGRPAGKPFVLLAQTSLFDPSRVPAGKQAAWAYCHVPNGSSENMTERIEAQVERFAPGFRERILGRHSMGPAELEAHNRNLVGGDLNGGVMDLGQLLLRPARKLVPYRTPLRGIYLCSASTPPGGGVHGMCGYSAARVALRDLRA
ncbi:MAG: NAD(P)/FAD-dependent oxidoreductase [Actinobacteria bacterium]|nr:MAG: NAD(P)/FAD-dependent oxidoreductase [Actinomycetota bacterium]